MMRRVIAPVAVALLGAFLVNMKCVQPLLCNRMRATIIHRNELIDRATPYRAAAILRQNINDAERCLAKTPGDVSLLFQEGEAWRRLGDNDNAIAAFNTALQYDRRPEIYIALGIAHEGAGHQQLAINALMQAARFYRDPGRIDYTMPGAANRELVKQRVNDENR